MKTESLIAYCGVDCSECVDFKVNKCPSCRLTAWKEDDICMPVKCCREKGIEFCSECHKFPCEIMKEFYEESDSHREALSRMIRMGKEPDH
ncbi:MAG: DUF3795 domain-containing protein [Eubacteriales bacterium]|nr:DUF3795 domain-containing protein [Eubacteriales bacterium]